MDSKKLLDIIQNLENRLDSDVRPAFYRGSEAGNERLKSWMNYAKKNLDPFSPKIFNELKDKPGFRQFFFGDVDVLADFDEYKREPILAYLFSLKIDVKNGEFDCEELEQNTGLPKSPLLTLRKAFIVHGHDDSTKLRTARFLEKLGFDAVILHEQASGGKTIIEKLEHFTDVGFGIVLYTPDDVGEAVANQANLRPRARQNVVFEHGLLLGKLGRERVLPLVTDHSVELPGDISGMVYMSDRNWEIDMAKEIKALGYEVDLNVLF